MKILTLHTKDANLFLSNLKQEGLVVLAGSAISCWEPSSLFSGHQFTQEMFNLLFTPSFLKNNANDEEITILKEFFEAVPFEHLLERYPNGKKLAHILKSYFSIDRFNRIHEVLAKGLIHGTIKGVITTNYDLCFDKVLRLNSSSTNSKPYTQFKRVITVEDHKNVKYNIEDARIYFKIHGSADDNSGETLVFTLTHESLLPKWKREILWQVLQNNSLLIIGYSGTDFEICPEIERIPLKQIIWNWRQTDTKSLNFPSNNAERILRNKSGTALIGDMKELLSYLFTERIEANWNPKGLDKVISQLRSKSEIEIMEWRASLLNSMGFPSLAFKSSEILLASFSREAMNTDFIQAERQKAQSLFHLGKYRDSAYLFRKAAKQAKELDQKDIEASLLLDVSSSYRAYGTFLRSIYNTIIARRIATIIPDREISKRIMGKVFLRYALMMREFYRISKFMRILFLTKSIIIGEMKHLLKIASSRAIETGNWHDFYQTRLIADQAEISISFDSTDYYEPPPTRDAYTQLGYAIPISTSKRQELNKLKRPLTSDEKRELSSNLKKNEVTENFPEAWKNLWFGITRITKWRKDKQIWRKFLTNYFYCQYTVGMRLLKPFIGE